MIFPYLRGILSPMLAPATYFLVLMNVLVFLVTSESFEKTQMQIDTLVEDETFVFTQGAAFSQMIQHDPKEFSSLLLTMAKRSQLGDRETTRALGTLALRNSVFMSEALDFEFTGDDVALNEWRHFFQKLLYLEKQHPSYLWGLTAQNRGHLRQWVSYQFVHSGGWHLFGNMLFLLWFGCFLEVLIGSSLVILTYLSAGIIGALFFSWFSGVGASPLVGASAAVSGLIGLVVILQWREKVKFFYILPFYRSGFFGMTLLPAWFILFVVSIPDLAGILSAVPDFNSVAHWAHVGGTLWGGCIAACMHAGWIESDVDDEIPA